MAKITIPRADIRMKLRLITDNIRKLRENSNYSQEYMAGKLCISQNTYSKLELGYTALTLERLILIAGILNTDILSLVNIFSDAGRQNGDNVFSAGPALITGPTRLKF